MNISIRVGIELDARRIAQVSENSFGDSWKENQLLEGICNPQCSVLLAETEEKQCVGYGICYFAGGQGEIPSIAVLPDYRNLGIGQRLLEELLTIGDEKQTQEYFLEVRKSNLAAIALYQKVGFYVVGERKGFYCNPVEDGLVMKLERI